MLLKFLIYIIPFQDQLFHYRPLGSVPLLETLSLFFLRLRSHRPRYDRRADALHRLRDHRHPADAHPARGLRQALHSNPQAHLQDHRKNQAVCDVH